MNDIPDVSFIVHKRGKVPDWIIEKRKYLEKNGTQTKMELN
jgi:hypothetical protein